MPTCTEQETPSSLFNEDLFQSASLIDLLQASPDVNMSYYMSDDEPLALPPLLPMLPDPELSPPSSVNVLDMISQDMLLGSSMSSSANRSSTEVTYASQYASSSIAPFTSAGDVFLPTFPITTASNTFVKPLNTFVKPLNTFVEPLPPARNAKTVIKPSPRHGSRSTTPARPASPKPVEASSPYEFVDELAPNQKLAFSPYTTSRKPSKSKTTARNSTKNSSSKSIGLHTLVETPSRSSSAKHGRSRSKGKNTLSSYSSKQSAFVSVTSRGGTTKSTATTHTATRPIDSNTDSVAFDTETVRRTTSTVTRTVSIDSIEDYWNSFKTAKVTKSKASRKQSTVTYASSRSELPTSTITSYSRSKTPASIISPMETTYSVPAGKITSRRPPLHASGATHRPVASSAPDDAWEQFRLNHIQSTQTTSADETAPSRTMSNTTTTSRVTYPARITQSMRTVTNVHTYATSTISGTTASSRTHSHSTITLPSSTSSYTPRKFPSAKSARSRNVPVTTESQTFAILDGKGSYTTLTISSDFATTTCSSIVVTESSSTVTAGFITQTPSKTSDSIVRTGSHMLISLPNSKMCPSTSVGYFLSSPLGSEIIARRPTMSATTQGTVATTIGTHTITTISSEAMNRIRSRLIIPVGHNVSNSAATLSASTISTDSNRPRGPVTIIANQRITAASPRDIFGASTTAADAEVTPTSRTLFSPSRGMYTLTTPVSSHLASGTSSDTATRTINRVVIPVIPSLHAASMQNSATTASITHSTTTPTYPAGHTPGTYLIATGMASSSSHTGGKTGRPSRVIIPIIHNTSATLTSTPVPNVTTSPFLGTSGENTHTSSMSCVDVQSRLRNRLIVQSSTTEGCLSSTTTPITAYTITRARAPQNVYAIPSTHSTYTSSTKSSVPTTLSPATMTLITFDKPSAATATAINSQNVVVPRPSHSAHSPSMTFSSLTTGTPTLANSGNRYVIKLASSASGPMTTSCTSTVTAAVATPITTAVVSPSDHRFAEPQPVSRLRTFPGPRTYSVAQRSSAGNVSQRVPSRTVIPRAPAKKVIMNPAPLQIFADVVCPPTTTQSHTTASDHAKPRFTLTHSAGSSNLVVPQYKNTGKKLSSTAVHVNPERPSSRLSGTRSSSDRFLLNRSLALSSPRRSTPSSSRSESQVAHTTSSTTHRTGRQIRFTYADMRSHGVRVTPAPPATEHSQIANTDPCTAPNNTPSTSGK